MYEEIKGYIGKKVVLTDVDGQKFRGVITNTESEFDTTSGKVSYGIPFDEIMCEAISDVWRKYDK